MGEGLNNASRDWLEDAHCRNTNMDTNLFFPERGQTKTKAEWLCRPCTVKNECLRYALDNNEWMGIWGGKSGRERRKIKQLEAGGRVWL